MQFVKSILKWVFLIVFVAPQAIGMAIFVGIPLYVVGAIAMLADDVLDKWRIGKMHKEIAEMERRNRQRGDG
jgi:hypothetical protein